VEKKHKIVLGVCGGIAAYKSADLAGALCKNGHEVRVVMTENAKKFITPLTLATMSKNPVFDDASEWAPDGVIKHIELSRWATLIIVCPATANTLYKMSEGIADNLLSSLFLARPKSTLTLICPAMNTQMWEKGTTARSIEALLSKGTQGAVSMQSPEEGMLACGEYGVGKLASIRSIVDNVESIYVPSK